MLPELCSPKSLSTLHLDTIFYIITLKDTEPDQINFHELLIMWVLISLSFRKAATFCVCAFARSAKKTKKKNNKSLSLPTVAIASPRMSQAAFRLIQKEITRGPSNENTMIAHSVLGGKTPPTCLAMRQGFWETSCVWRVPAGQITASGVKWVVRGWYSLLDNLTLIGWGGPQEEPCARKKWLFSRVSALQHRRHRAAPLQRNAAPRPSHKPFS